ncbi:MAG: TetR/AcrR family transcriptional regulator [Lachnospiraceae bacterium]
MATTYKTGNQTKEKIINETKILLYKQGFSKTTYDDISAAANINRALIPYHFKSKQVLGQTIYAEIIQQFEERFDSILDISEFSPDFISILHITAYYQLLQDEHFSKFVYELQADKDFSVFMKESEASLLDGLIHNNTKLSESEITILLASEVGMKKELFYLVNTSDIDINEAAKLQLYMLLSYAGYSKKKTEDLYNSAMQVINMLSFKITKNFQVKIDFN